MKTKHTRCLSLLLSLLLVFLLTACHQETPSSAADPSSALAASSQAGNTSDDALVSAGRMELQYAKNFSVEYFEGGYALAEISDGKRFLTVPEGKEVPEGIDEDIIVLQQPLQHVLISSTPTMSLINAIGALDAVTMTTTDKDGWYIDEVVAAFDQGRLSFIGSYKEPDYEMIVAENPPFAVFSTMLDSVPDVAAKLDELGIEYLLDQSTYEDHPLARTEWIKLYGVLFGKEEEAIQRFADQVHLVDALSVDTQTGKTAVIFYITSKGDIYVRNAGDYIVEMLNLAGGSYVFSDLNVGQSGTQKIEGEAFYAGAKEADFIVYIHNLGGKPAHIEEFLAKYESMADFKAVREGNVWCTTPNFFQISDTLGGMIADLSEMMATDQDQLTYLFKLK